MSDDDSRIEQKKKERERDKSSRDYDIVPYIVIFLFVIIVAAISYTFFIGSGGITVADEPEGVKALDNAQHPTMVAENATVNDTDNMVEVIYYGDYGCPFCARYDSTTFPQFKEDYIETGKVVYRFKVVDFIDDTNSRPAALADRAVWEQSPQNYWQWHKTTFANHQGEGRRWATNNRIRKWTDEIAGLNGSDVIRSVNNNRHSRVIQQNSQDFRRDGARGTPTLIVNGTPINPLDNYDEMESIIEESLEDKRGN